MSATETLRDMPEVKDWLYDDESVVYGLLLTQKEWVGLEFCHDRGYAGDILKHCAKAFDIPGKGVAVIFTREHQAWAWMAQCDKDGEAFLACMGRSLKQKVSDLYEEIV